MGGMMSEDLKVPGHWEIKKLGEVATYINGKAFKTTEWSNSGLPIIRIQNLNNEKSEFNYCGFQVEEKYYVNKGDLLFAWSGTPDTSFGAHVWTGGRAVLNQHIFKITVDEKLINKRYYLHALNHKVREFINTAHGAAGLAHITKKKFEESEIPLPPLPEQKAIVARIEQLLSDLENGKQQLLTAQQQLKIYRQSLLKAAFEGKLTNKNVKEGELPKGWKWAALGEICDPKRKCSYGVLVPGDHVENGITLLRVGDIDEYGKIDQNAMKKISPAVASKFKRTFLDGGEVVISLVGAIGRTAVVPQSLKGANTARAVGVIPVSKDVSAKFVEAMLRCPVKIKEHNDSSHEVARKTLNLEDVVKSKIPLPPLAEQHLIVSELESKLTVCDKIAETITQSLAQAETLRQSILKKAFEGKLVRVAV
jgi:type I restriction enzyme, S subunit